MDVASSSDSPGEGSDSVIELNIKTLDSQIYSFHVDKNTSVSSFKEKVAEKIGLPVPQQRLIFRGKVLKDEHLLSEYHVENGHTLHLVERQPAQSQPSSGPSSGETNANNGAQGNDGNDGAGRNRLGRISHSVVLGTFNVGEQGEGAVPDVTRVIGAVLNSLGLGNQTAPNSGQNFATPIVPGQASHGNGAASEHGNTGGRTQAGNSTQPGQLFPSQPFQIPLAGASVPLPSFNTPIPDSLNTLCEFMNQLEGVLLQIGNPHDQSSPDILDRSTTELPSNAAGVPTPEALSIVLRRAEQLLEGGAIASISHIAGRLEQDLSSTDPSVRSRVQSELLPAGLAIQHLGALFLELGRTMLTLRIGQSPAESAINSGPAVYISPQGPNPLMVQPFPLQTSPLFNSGNGANASPAPATLGHIGVIGSAPRNINIHIHAGTAFAPLVSAAGPRAGSAEGTQGEHTGGSTVPGDMGSAQILRNVIAPAIPRSLAGVSSAPAVGPAVPGVSSSQPPDSSSLASIVAELNAEIRNCVDSLSTGSSQSSGMPHPAVGLSSAPPMGPAVTGVSTSQAPASSSQASVVAEINAELRRQVESLNLGTQQSSGLQEGAMQNYSIELDRGSDPGGLRLTDEANILRSEALKVQSESQLEGTNSSKLFQASSSSSNNELKAKESSEITDVTTNAAKSVPLGLGMLGLQPKRRTQSSNVQPESGESRTSGAISDQSPSTVAAGQQVLQSLASSIGRNPLNEDLARRMPQAPAPSIPAQNSIGQQPDMMGLMSQVLGNPAFNGLLSGIAGQTGVGSADDLRGMFQQLTQSPDARNSINQLAQQVSREDFSNVLTGAGSGRGQGGGAMDFSSMFQQMMPIVSRALSGNSAQTDPFVNVERDPQPEPTSIAESSEIDIQEIVERINTESPPQDILRAMLAACLPDNEAGSEELLEELSANEDLANEFMEVLSHDVQCRFQDGSD